MRAHFDRNIVERSLTKYLDNYVWVLTAMVLKSRLSSKNLTKIHLRECSTVFILSKIQIEFIQSTLLKLKSLIMAQIERWRQA